MLRQPAFGIGLSTLVFVSVVMSSRQIQKHSEQLTTENQRLLIPSTQATTLTNIDTITLENSVFQQVNQYRLSRQLPTLTLNPHITQQARVHSQNMAKGAVPFSHQGFEQRVEAVPVRYSSASENVAFNQGYSDPATEAVNGWLKSPGHLHNIQGNYNLTGIGVATNQKGEVYLTQIFIRSR